VWPRCGQTGSAARHDDEDVPICGTSRRSNVAGGLVSPQPFGTRIC